MAKSLTKTTLPERRPPTHPGVMLLEEFLKPLGLTQTELAERIRVSYPRVNEIVNGKRGITPDTALRLAKLFGTTPEFWLNGQRNWDLWHAMHARAAHEIDEIEPVTA
ncbi:MAG: HigA family addiction module antidote protein [Gemmatimonadales bacterium]|nr:HigA family addiction module antidote protein [Gemmatimonadales bacterium]NIP06047.1 HigA family addiction module antidote protein [Gemmatimonadales bacterium]NIR01124.1 HigA family addiction module antidote protein [Gemmatimonadales bacterium]NIS65171.1 HigA family addiction module antidote protein [Gemmatimonadales bacterium]